MMVARIIAPGPASASMFASSPWASLVDFVTMAAAGVIAVMPSMAMLRRCLGPARCVFGTA